jgi:hypothetical protein
MILLVKTDEFSKATTYEKKKILSKFFGHKVNQIVSGSLTNGKYGDFRVRHEDIAYSNIRIATTETGHMHIKIWNFQTEAWQEEAE